MALTLTGMIVGQKHIFDRKDGAKTIPVFLQHCGAPDGAEPVEFTSTINREFGEKIAVNLSISKGSNGKTYVNEVEGTPKAKTAK